MRARLGDNLDVFLAGLRRLLQDFGDWQTPPMIPAGTAARDALGRRVHKLVGSSGVIGARRIHELAKAIEQQLRTGQGEGLEGPFEALGRELVVLAQAATPQLAAADTDKQALEAAEREHSHPLDPVALSKLREQLAQNDFAVLTTLKALAPALRATLAEAIYRRIEQSISAWDFKAALEAAEPSLARATSAASGN